MRAKTWIRVVEIKNIELKKALTAFLDEGEAANLILLDDYEAREFARIYKLKIIGTIGVLLKAKYTGRISNISEILEKLRETGFWLNDNLYSKILREAEEL